MAAHSRSIQGRKPSRHCALPRFGDRRALRVGLLGGSFNPAHEGHRMLAWQAMRRLGLDQVWLLVSPGNPLKPDLGMAPFDVRLASAESIADGRRVIATDIERHAPSHFTAETLVFLRRRFPRVQFVWLMGADNLVQLPRWRGWRDLIRHTRFAVMPRPTYNRGALAEKAARWARRWRVPASRAPALTCLPAPRWVFLQARQTALSATALRSVSEVSMAGEGP